MNYLPGEVFMKKIYALVIFVLICLNTAWAADEIRVTDFTTGTGLGCYGRCGYISATFKVKNIAYHKYVGIYYRLNGTEWRELPGYYVRPLEDGYEEWKINMNVGERGQNLEFVAKYEVEGQVYWDNNGSNNYFGGLN